MQIIKIIVFGALGALGLLRGVELVLTGQINGALIPGLIGFAFALAFLQEMKKRRSKR